MNRRDVLKLGAIAAAGPGCMPPLLRDLHGPDGGERFNAMLDEQLAALARPGLLQQLVAGMAKTPLSPEAHAKIAAHDARFREMLGTLLITQGFRELPEATQAQARVQERMWTHAARIGRSVDELHRHLSSLDAAQRAQVQAALRDQPDLPMALGEALDGQMVRAGLSLRRRGQLRGMMKQAAFRLRHGDPGVVLDELAAKAERIAASMPRDAAALALAQKVGERAFWQAQREAAHEPPAPELPLGGGAEVQGGRAGATGLRVGAYMLGIGFALGATSLALVAIGGAGDGIGIVSATFAAISFSIGLIVLLISAIVYAASA